jgi:endonuclease-8
MPEGDTILRAARALGSSLRGKRVVSFESSLPRLAEAGLAGRRVETVEARGKNLLVHFDDGRALRTHMRMTGSWHLYRPNEKWKKPARLARVVLSTADAVAVCFNAPVVELLTARQLARHESLRRLGPDVLAEAFDPSEAVGRIGAQGVRPIGEALLLQSALAGIGNIYKSEALFLCGVDPFAPVASFSEKDLARVVAKARELMSANLDGTPRKTRRTFDGASYWVYARSGKACFRCGTRIRMRRQGDAGRSTYWCPGCQPALVPQAAAP